MNADMMKEALKRKRAKGLDIAIVLGGHPGSDTAATEGGVGATDEQPDKEDEDKSEDLGLAPDVEDADTHLGEDEAGPRGAVLGDKLATDEELGDTSDHPEDLKEMTPEMGGGAPMKGAGHPLQHMGKLLGAGGKSGLRNMAFKAHMPKAVDMKMKKMPHGPKKV
jgi:hypothetical protein